MNLKPIVQIWDALVKSLKTLGYDCHILSSSGDPEPSPLDNLPLSQPPAVQQPVEVPLLQKPITYHYYTDSGNQYRICPDNSLEKKKIVAIDSDELKRIFYITG